ncbi:MAG: BMC domain-containing protein [bacterium]|nr:BMC domain-containing protein [bacterium]
MTRPALGLIETKGLSGAIQATHAATKAGDVVIASAERIEDDRITVKIEGDWAAVQTAVEAGARAADAAGELISMHVIPRTDNGVVPILPYARFVARYHPEDLGFQAPPKPKPKPKTPAQPSKPAAKPSAPTVPKPKVTPPVTSSPVTPSRVTPPKPAPPAVTAPAPAVSTAAPLPMNELEALSVVALRRYARTVPGLPIQGRQISMANKQKLLEAIQAARAQEPKAS